MEGMEENILIRCSALHAIMGEPKSKEAREKGELSKTAQDYVITVFKENLLKASGVDVRLGFKGNKYTEKGLVMEDTAIKNSGMIRFKSYKKNETRLNNGLITGECDIYDEKNRLIIDTKCTYSIESHPFFLHEAEQKASDAGYDLQMQGYMWLYDCDYADVDFWLLPTPPETMRQNEDSEILIDAVNNIPLNKRVTTVRYKRNDLIIKQIERKAAKCQEFYKRLLAEFQGKKFGRNSTPKTETEKPENPNRKVVLL